MRLKVIASLGLVLVTCLGAADAGCTFSAAQKEAATVDQTQGQIVRNQPSPVFDYSRERQMLIAIYRARQAAVSTWSYVQSPFNGRVLWSCPSLGYPLPYATQLTNPQMPLAPDLGTSAIVAEPEPNGLYPPSTASGTWVPCVDGDGAITPVYEERDVTVFSTPMDEAGGMLVPQSGAKASLAIPADARP